MGCITSVSIGFVGTFVLCALLCGMGMSNTPTGKPSTLWYILSVMWPAFIVVLAATSYGIYWGLAIEGQKRRGKFYAALWLFLFLGYLILAQLFSSTAS